MGMKPWSPAFQMALLELHAHYTTDNIISAGRCPLCVVAQGKHAIECNTCPWMIMTGKMCVNWVLEEFPEKTKYTMASVVLSTAKAFKEKWFLEKRVPMLEEWIKHWENS